MKALFTEVGFREFRFQGVHVREWRRFEHYNCCDHVSNWFEIYALGN